MNKLFVNIEQKQIDVENRIVRGIIASTGTIDRQGESLNPKGWVLDNFKKNPVILFGHDYSSLPIGKAINVNEVTFGGNYALSIDVEFAKTQMAEEVFQLIKDGFMNTVSVGFIPSEWGVAGKDPYTYMKMELLEVSVVPVPANPEALIQVRAFEEKFAKEFQKSTDEEIVVEEKENEINEEENTEESAESADVEPNVISESEEKPLTVENTGSEDDSQETASEQPKTDVEEEKVEEEVKEEEKVEDEKSLVELSTKELLETLRNGMKNEKTYSEKDLEMLKSIREELKEKDIEVGLVLRHIKNILKGGE